MTFEDLTKEQQNMFTEIGKNLNNAQLLFIALTEKNRCLYCKTKFKDGLLKKSPGKFIPCNAYSWFTPEYLVHLKDTHGIEPDDMTYYMKIINKEI